MPGVDAHLTGVSRPLGVPLRMIFGEVTLSPRKTSYIFFDSFSNLCIVSFISVFVSGVVSVRVSLRIQSTTMSSSGISAGKATSGDKKEEEEEDFFINLINLYFLSVKAQPNSIAIEEGQLRIRDVEVPRKQGDLKAKARGPGEDCCQV